MTTRRKRVRKARPRPQPEPRIPYSGPHTSCAYPRCGERFNEEDEIVIAKGGVAAYCFKKGCSTHRGSPLENGVRVFRSKL